MTLATNLLATRRLRGHAPAPDTTTPPLGVFTAANGAGLLDVWNYKQTAGIKNTPNKSIFNSSDRATLPAGASWDLVTTGAFYVLFDLGGTLSQWDFTGVEVYVDNSTLNLTDCRLGYPSTATAIGGVRLATARNTGTMNLTSCDWNVTNTGNAGGGPGHGSTNLAPGNTMNWVDVHAWGAPRIYADVTGTFTRDRCFMEAFGINTDFSDHGEGVKIDNGSLTVSNTVIDLTQGGTIVTGLTGVEYVSADSTGNITVSYTRCIVNFPDYLSLLYPMVLGTDGVHTISATFTNCAIKGGVTSHFSATAGVTITDGGGNVDLITGATISMAYP